MIKKYKIGEISKFLGIPMSNLRFYEEKGIVTPHKDDNSYRYYDAWNINALIDTLHYKKMDFSLNDISHIINDCDLDEMIELFKKQEQKILSEITRQQNILNVLSQERIRIQYLKEYLNTFTVCLSPKLIFMRFRKKNTLQDVSGNQDIASLNNDLKKWLNAYPNGFAAFYIPLNSILHDDNVEYWYGFSIDYEDAPKNNIQLTGPNEFIPSLKSIYSVFEAKEEGSFYPSFYTQVYEPIIEQGYMISGSPIGRLITKTNEKDGSYHRYFEVWVPIKE